MNSLSELLAVSRHKGGKSQEYMAEKIGVSTTTIKSWESGRSAPSIDNAIEWFRYSGVNPVRYLMRYAHPNVYSDRENVDVEDAFRTLVDTMITEDKYALLYLFLGDHGSSPSAIIQMMLAHLHNPLRDRIPIAWNIFIHYDLNERKGELICNDYPMPNKEELQSAIEEAIEAFSIDNDGYVLVKNRAENRAEK